MLKPNTKTLLRRAHNNRLVHGTEKGSEHRKAIADYLKKVKRNKLRRKLADRVYVEHLRQRTKDLKPPKKSKRGLAERKKMADKLRAMRAAHPKLAEPRLAFF